jgi:PKD repeat protein
VLRLDANGDIPGCSVIGTSTATVTDTTAAAQNTNATVLNTYILPLIVDINDFDTALLTATQCSGSPLGRADFSADPVSGLRPLLVQFTDLSSGGPTSWLWDFGDGQTSTEQNPSHTYQLAGDYTVSLTTDGPEGTDTETKTDFIQVQHVAGFTGSPDAGIAPLTVYFLDESQGNISDWFWDFGDGQTSNQRKPDHKYFDPGFYTVSLTVTDAYGPDTVTKTDYIEVEGYGAPHINKLDPNICLPNEKIKIGGYNFGDIQGTSVVHIGSRTFDSSTARIKVWENRKIKIKVPNYKCSRFDGKEYIRVKVWVTVDDTDSNIVKLKIMKPATCP